jgi:hypothetical protein
VPGRAHALESASRDRPCHASRGGCRLPWSVGSRTSDPSRDRDCAFPGVGLGLCPGVDSEMVDSEMVDSETVDSETVDSETVDSETVDSETVDSDAVPARPLLERLFST